MMMIKMKMLICLLSAMMLLSACGSASKQQAAKPGPSASASPSIVKTTEQDAAKAVMLALKQRDLETLITFIHPEKGLLLSPYAHIQPDAITFQRDKLPAFTDSTLYTWGMHDGSGEPITLTFQEYYDQYIYDKPFYEAEKIGYNEILQPGNMEINISEMFPGSFTADFHFSGFDKKYEGMDWESLILVIEPFNGFWYVSAIIHSQWTV